MGVEYAWRVYGDPLTPLERDVIGALVSPAHPVLDALRAQLAGCRTKSREFTAVGFYTRLVLPKALAVAGIDRLALSDLAAEIEGLPHGAGFVLFVEDGMLELLEGFTYVGPWPDRVEAFTVRGPTPPSLGHLHGALPDQGGSHSRAVSDQYLRTRGLGSHYSRWEVSTR
jgi:hypothetical protein